MKSPLITAAALALALLCPTAQAAISTSYPPLPGGLQAGDKFYVVRNGVDYTNIYALPTAYSGTFAGNLTGAVNGVTLQSTGSATSFLNQQGQYVTVTSGGTYTNGTGLGLTNGAFSVLYGTGPSTAAQGNDSRFALAASALQPSNNLSDLASPSAARGNLGLGSAATANATAFLQPANNLSDVASPATARTNLGLGTAATFASTAFAQAANNLSDLASAAVARLNLGLGALATQSAVTAAQLPTLTGDISNSSSGVTTVNAIKGVTVAGTTGTGNNVFSASPTLTGTLNGAAAAFSGAVTASTFNGVALSNAGSATSFLNAAGTYTTPATSSGGITQLTGDVTTPANSSGIAAATLASVGTPGTYGSASSVNTITTDAKGRVTSVVSNAIAIGSSQVSGLGPLAGQSAVLASQMPALTGDVTSSAGSTATAISASAVTGKALTGFSAAAGTVSATDTILSAFNKLVGNVNGLVTGVSSVFGRTGAVTAQSGDYSVSQVAGAAPLASPAFTGVATFNSTGAAMPTLPAGTVVAAYGATPFAAGMVAIGSDIPGRFSAARNTTTALPANTQTGTFNGGGFDGSALIFGAAAIKPVTGATPWSATNHSMGWGVDTTPEGTTSLLTNAVQITPAGQLLANYGAAITGAFNAVTGAFSSTLSAGATTVASLTNNGADTIAGLLTANGGAVVSNLYAQLRSDVAGLGALSFNNTGAAAANTTILQSALNAAGDVALSCPSGSVLYTSNTLVIYSNTHFTVGAGCTIRQASGTNKTIVTNNAAQSAWTSVYDSTGSTNNGPLNIFSIPGSWAVSTGYARGAYTSANSSIYWQASGAACTSAGTGSGPSGTGTAIADGTCSWNYVTAATPVATASPYTSSTRSTYYAIMHFPSHGLSVGNFVWDTPQPDSNGYLWTGTGSAGALGGPADTSYFGVFPIVAVNDANYITVELRRAPASAFTGIPIKEKQADENIVVDGGGTFDYNYSQNPGSTTNYLLDDTAVLWGIHHFILNNLYSVNSYKYAFNVGALSDYDIGHVQGGSAWTQTSGVNGDQMHIYGPAFDGIVHDMYGMGYDDTLVFSTSDNVTNNNYLQLLGVGDVYKATARNIGGIGGQRLGLFSSQAAGLLRIENVLLDNIETYSQRISNPSILIGGNGQFNDITVQNSTIKNASAPFFQVGSNATGSGVTMDRLKFLNNDIVQSSSNFINIANASASPITIGDLSIVHTTINNMTAQVVAETVTSGVALTVNNLVIDDLSMPNATANLLIVQAGATFPHVVISNSYISQTSAVSAVNAVNATDVTFAHNRVDNGTLLYSGVSGAIKMHMLGNQLNAGAYVAYMGNSSPTLSLYSDGTNVLNSSTWFRYGGTAPPTTAYGFDIQCDVTKLTRATGQYCYNTNTAPGSGTLTTAGIVMDQGTAANSWFLMSNPSGQQY